MSIVSVLKFIISHPLNKHHRVEAINRFVKWQINARLNPHPVIYPFTEKCKLIIQKGMAGATGNLYCGLHEYNDMSFLLHFLRKEDVFADIGANIGSYTVLASGHIGAKTLSFEPVPSTFTHLQNNICINRIENLVTTYNIALGAKHGFIDFTSTHDTTNHVAVENDINLIKVEVNTLDSVLEKYSTPTLLKIDVEGFETEVLAGAYKTLRSADLKAIIIELNNSGNRYGYNEQKNHENLLSLGFMPFFYNPEKRELIPINNFGTHNTIYIRDLDFAHSRVSTANKVKILGQEL
jgi:FkbM family methyltransferase